MSGKSNEACSSKTLENQTTRGDLSSESRVFSAEKEGIRNTAVTLKRNVQIREGTFERFKKKLCSRQRVHVSIGADAADVVEHAHGRSITVLQGKRRPRYRYIALPPGYIPSEVILDENDGDGDRATLPNSYNPMVSLKQDSWPPDEKSQNNIPCNRDFDAASNWSNFWRWKAADCFV